MFSSYPKPHLIFFLFYLRKQILCFGFKSFYLLKLVICDRYTLKRCSVLSSSCHRCFIISAEWWEVAWRWTAVGDFTSLCHTVGGSLKLNMDAPGLHPKEFGGAYRPDSKFCKTQMNTFRSSPYPCKLQHYSQSWICTNSCSQKCITKLFNHTGVFLLFQQSANVDDTVSSIVSVQREITLLLMLMQGSGLVLRALKQGGVGVFMPAWWPPRCVNGSYEYNRRC